MCHLLPATGFVWVWFGAIWCWGRSMTWTNLTWWSIAWRACRCIGRFSMQLVLGWDAIGIMGNWHQLTPVDGWRCLKRNMDMWSVCMYWEELTKKQHWSTSRTNVCQNDGMHEHIPYGVPCLLFFSCFFYIISHGGSVFPSFSMMSCVVEAIFILLPKTLLWLGVTRSGVHYLLETAGIMNVVVNAMALSFILNAPWISEDNMFGTNMEKIPTSQC